MKWMLAAISAFITVIAPMARADEASGWIVSPLGRTIFEGFPEAPYPYASRVNGHTYQGKVYSRVSHYNDSTIGIFVPAGFKPSSAGVNFIVHFHGWHNHVAKVLDTYKLREQVQASHLNAVLIVPQGPYDAPDSDYGRLEHEPKAFAALLNHVANFLKDQGIIPTVAIGHIVLSAHSGGYGGLSGVLKVGGLSDLVTDVLLFDAAYGKLDAFSKWLAGPDRRLVTVFTDDTISGNVELLSMIQKTHTVSRVIMRSDLTPEVLLMRGASFVYTPDIPHDEVMQKFNYYELFLKTSALAQH